MNIEEIEKFLDKKTTADLKYVKISFKKRDPIYGLFLKEKDFVYLKANDEKSKRTIEPSFVGEMEYLGKQYIGVIGFDSKRQEDRNFRVDKILEMKLI